MKKELTKLALLACFVVAGGVFANGCSGGDDDDDDDDGAGTVLKGDGTAAVFTGCPAATGSGGSIDLLVSVGAQGTNPTTPPDPLQDADIVLYNPATGATGGMTFTTDASGEVVITTSANTYTTAKISHAPDGAITYIDTYNYGYLAPGADQTATPEFSWRIIPASTLAAIRGDLVGSTPVTGLISFAGSANDCDGDAISGATVTVGSAVPPACLGPGEVSVLPCLAYSTSNLGLEETTSSGQFFLIGLPGTTNSTIEVHGVLTAGAAAQDLGSLTVRGEPDAIVLGAVPANDVP